MGSTWASKTPRSMTMWSRSDVIRSRRSCFTGTYVKTRDMRLQASAGPSDVFVLELDGVLVDAFREKTKCACRAAIHLFPEDIPRNILQHDSLIDTIAETDRLHALPATDEVSIFKTLADLKSLEEHLTVQEILDLSLKSDLSIEHLSKAIREAREDWIDEEEADWIGTFKTYPGVKEALASCGYPFYFTSSHSPAISSLILTQVLNQEIPPDSPRLFSNSMDSRVIQSRPMCQEERVRLHFISSTPTALGELSAKGMTQKWKLYYADWSYKDDERQNEAKEAGAKVLDLNDFVELMKWGVVMGVDDGCEPTPEEVQEQTEDFENLLFPFVNFAFVMFSPLIRANLPVKFAPSLVWFAASDVRKEFAVRGRYKDAREGVPYYEFIE